MTSVQTLHKILIEEWKKENKNLEYLGQIIQQLKDKLKSNDDIKCLNSATSNLIFKDFLEISALYYVLTNNLIEFEQAIAKVNCFYETFNDEIENKYLMTGLYLMYLLSSERVSEFHLLLEQIDQLIQQENPFIKTPVQMEQFLVEGAYNKIMLNRQTLPSFLYAGFVQTLLNSVRNEIAACLEKSYKTLPFNDACVTLLFENKEEAIAFGKQRFWKINNNKEFEFTTTLRANENDAVKSTQIDAKRIIEQNLYYAKQLEMII